MPLASCVLSKSFMQKNLYVYLNVEVASILKIPSFYFYFYLSLIFNTAKYIYIYEYIKHKFSCLLC